MVIDYKPIMVVGQTRYMIEKYDRVVLHSYNTNYNKLIIKT